jgi:TonB family protein
MCLRYSASLVLLVGLAISQDVLANEGAAIPMALELSKPSYNGPYLGLPKCDHLDGPTNEEMAKNPGYVVVRYTIDKRGRAAEVSILESVPSGYYDDLVLAYLRECVLEEPKDTAEFRTDTVRFGP